MYFIKKIVLSIIYSIFIFPFVFTIENLLLKNNNFVTIKDNINIETKNKFILDIASVIIHTNNPIIYIDSNGGSVFEGNKIIEQINFYKNNDINISCIAITAYSMAFHIFQTCNNRYLLETSRLMTHQIKITINDMELLNLHNYLTMINNINKILDINVSKRIKMSYEDYVNKYKNDWWIDSITAINENLADKIVYIGCDKTLYNDLYIETIEVLNNNDIISFVKNNKNSSSCPL